MKRLITIILSASLFMCAVSGCKDSDFAKDYANPSKVSKTQLGQQYTGAMQAILNFVIPSYDRYFIVEQPWIAPFTQSAAKIKATGMYKVGADASNRRWSSYYDYIAQYREFQRIYDNMSAEDKKTNRIYYITATIYMYDQTEKMVDLYGDIPWSEAGYVGEYGNDYTKALPKFDAQEDIYSTMLDSLKIFANELVSIQVPKSVELQLQNQDFINFGQVDLWQRYCNSLRVRMLTRVSSVPSFQQRYQDEMQTIVDHPTKYPLVLENDQNIQVDVLNIDGEINSEGWNQGIGSEGWNLDIATEPMMDFMNQNNDPRRRVIFQKGDSSDVYAGINENWSSKRQNDSINAGVVTIYNQTTFDDNKYFPGVLVTASEVNFDLAEYYLHTNGYSDANAKTYYNQGIEESIKFYFAMQDLSQNTSRGGIATPLGTSEINDYLNEPGVKWSTATSDQDALEKIAYQDWVHFNIVQNTQNWSNYRRLDLPKLTFPRDHSGTQKTPPLRFTYSTSEITLNKDNYNKVKSEDNLDTKIFWDTH